MEKQKDNKYKVRYKDGGKARSIQVKCDMWDKIQHMAEKEYRSAPKMLEFLVDKHWNANYSTEEG